MPTLSNPPVAKARRASKYLRPELENLVRALAALQEPDRSAVVAAAREQAQGDRRGPTISLDDWESPRWVLGLGGNAVEDCDWVDDDA